MSDLVKSCGVLLIRGNPAESFLLMRHPDRWDLPKGHVDPGESEIECALRELEEETGISRDQVALDRDFRFEHHYTVTSQRHGEFGRPKVLVVFLARVQGEPEITVTEHDGYSWFPWSPPHAIQKRTIDPLLLAVDKFLSERDRVP